MAKRKPKFQIYKTTCKRCGKEVWTGNRALHAPEEIKQKYERICERCMTDEERKQMDKDIREAYSNGFRPF